MTRLGKRLRCLAAVLAFEAACASPPPSRPPTVRAEGSLAEVERHLASDAPPATTGPRIASSGLSFASRPGWRAVPSPADSKSVELSIERTGSRVYIFAAMHVGAGRRLDEASAGMRAQARAKDRAITIDEHRFFLDEASLAPASLIRADAAGQTTWSLAAVSGDRMLVVVAVGEDLARHEADTIAMMRSVRFAEVPAQP